MIKRLIVFIILIVGIVSLVNAQDARTVNVSAYGVQMGFAQERTKIMATEVASNVLFVTNNTNKTMELDLQVNAPAGWKLYGLANQKVKIESKDTLYFPIRTRPSIDIKGNTNYVVNVFLSTETFTISNAMWYVVVDKVSAWHAYTPNNKLYFTGEQDSVGFELIIDNDGNSDEALRVSLEIDKELVLINSVGEIIGNFPISVYLLPHKDTTIFYRLRLLDLVSLPEGSNASEDIAQKKYRCKLKVVNEKTGKGNNKNWTGSIEMLKVLSKRKIMPTKYNALPLVVDFNTYDAFSRNVYANLSLYGSRNFENNSMLNYYFQADFIDNKLNANSYLGNYQYLGYTHDRYSIEIGDIGANRSGSTLSGKGAKGSVSLFNNTLGAIYIRKPKLFEDFYASGYGLFHELNIKAIHWDNYYQHMDNKLGKVASDFGTSMLNFKIGRIHSFRIGGGYSTENHQWNPAAPITVVGYGWQFGYNTNIKKFGFNLNAQNSTPSYLPMRGIFNYSSSASYRISNVYQLGLFYTHQDFKPEIYTQGLLSNVDVFNINDFYSLKFMINKGENTFMIQPQYSSVKSNSIEAVTQGASFEYRYQARSPFKFYSSTYMGYSNFPKFADVGNIFIGFVRASARYNKFQANIRYYYGPYYQVEQLQFIQTNINPQKFYANVFYDYWFLNNKMKLSLNLNYFFTTVNDRQQINSRPELFYYAKNGFRFSFYGRYLMYADGQYFRTYTDVNGNEFEELVPSSVNSRFEFGVGVKFNVNVPIGLQRNYDVKIIAFRDLNGNGTMELNENGISDMLIHIRLNSDSISEKETGDFYQNPSEYDLVTNGDGLVEYQNIPMGNYVITAMPLASMGGWFDGKTFYRMIDKNKTIYIPLSRGAKVSGGVLLERDRYGTSKVLNLGNIRVTAVNQDDGHSFSTLTSSDGNFSLFVPNGNYLIMINESAVSTQFEFLQNNIPITINKDFENYNVSFYLVEKQRQIKVNGKTSRPLPIRRAANPSPTEGSNKPVSDSLPEQRTQLDDPKYLPVTEPTEQGTVWVIQLFPNEEARKLVADFTSMESVSKVRCITGSNSGFLYITESFTEKNDAKKLLKKVTKAGFEKGQVVSMVFGNKEVEDSPKPDSIPVIEEKKVEPVPSDSPLKEIIKFNSKEDRAFYRVEVKASASALNPSEIYSIVPDIQVYEILQDGLYKYSVGKFSTFEEAKTYKTEIVQKFNLVDSFVTNYEEAW
jgi:hypothetical protein